MERHLGRFPWRQAASFLYQALEALKGMHASAIVHSDFKPSNCYWNPEALQLWVGDFGLAVDRNEQPLAELLQTPDYQAPEVWSERYADSSIDVWSVGVSALELLLGRIPAFPTLYHRLVYLAGEAPPELAQRLRGKSLELGVSRVYGDQEGQPMDPRGWQATLRERGVINGLAEAQVEQLVDLLTQMLAYEKRIGASEALFHPLFAEIISFRFGCAQELEGAYRLELWEGGGKRALALPLRQRMVGCHHFVGNRAQRYEWRLVKWEGAARKVQQVVACQFDKPAKVEVFRGAPEEDRELSIDLKMGAHWQEEVAESKRADEEEEEEWGLEGKRSAPLSQEEEGFFRRGNAFDSGSDQEDIAAGEFAPLFDELPPTPSATPSPEGDRPIPE
jgi:hypothetical protein